MHTYVRSKWETTKKMTGNDFGDVDGTHGDDEAS
jgi:hypothetical protein